MSRTAFAIISSGFLLAGAAALPATASTGGSTAASDPSAPPRAVFVDDDRAQCPQADYTSVDAAIQEASPGATVRVCPGVYTEFVNIDKALRLIGQIGAVDNTDCFASAASQPGDLDATKYALLTRPAGKPGNLLTVSSGSATVAGLVLQGATTVIHEGPIADAAIELESGSAGTRVHHNLLRLNSLGIDLGSDGSATTRVDHNCLRGDLGSENTWAMASQRQDFVGGLVDNNQTFKHKVFAYGVGDLAATRKSDFADNVSRQDGIGFFVTGSSDISITGNRILDGTATEVFFQATLGPSEDALVAGNQISGFGSTHTGGIGIAIPSDATGRATTVSGVEVANNVVSGNAVGVSAIITNPGIEVHDNTATNNRQYGIRVRRGAPTAPVFGATFTNNTMLGNGSPPFGSATNDADALDGTFVDGHSPNTWIGNVCEHDFPVGALCEPPPATP